MQSCHLCSRECVGEDGLHRDEAAVELFCREPEMSACSATCPVAWLGDGECDSGCESADCNFDGGDCSAPVPAAEGTAPTTTTTTTAVADGGVFVSKKEAV